MEVADTCSDTTDGEIILTPKSSDGMNTCHTSPKRILIIGDSMTQGQEGDYTWRYRLWQWFQQQNIAIEIVGPYTGTMQPNPVTALPDPNVNASGGYAKDSSPSFSSRHFSAWGRAAWQMKGMIADVVAKYQPDMILSMLGFNDMGWAFSDAIGTLESVRLIVEHARKVKPDIDFALANVVHRRHIRDDLIKWTDEFNGLLAESVRVWNRWGSRVHLVRLRQEYQCEPDRCPAGYDGLHPNSLGDYQIARAFSKTLVDDFGMGKAYLEVPSHIPPRVLTTPTSFQIAWQPGVGSATWDRVYGAYGYDVATKRSGEDKDWVIVPTIEARWAWVGLSLSRGCVCEIRVRSQAGDSEKSEWSETKSIYIEPRAVS